ncbi:MAG: DUF6600 domain-containing protein, partial [Planctomycetota bacterium]
MFSEEEHETAGMWTIKALCACALLFLGSVSLYASEGFEDLVKMIKAGTDEQVLTAFVDKSQVIYALTDDERFYLTDLGLSREMIKYIDEHGKPGANPVPPPPPNAADVQQDLADAPPPETDPPAEEVAQEAVMYAPPPAETPPAEADFSTFYHTMSPYGSWLKIDGTWYWQPTATLINRTWSPYMDGGHWANTDDGWLWQSSYNWGWGPFHYGRWWRHSRHNWIWMPGTDWAPAWVNWRQSEGAIGWAPLPPRARFEVGVGLRIGDFGLEWRHYNFVAAEHFGEPQLALHRMPRIQVHTIYSNTKLIQNNYTVAENRIVNRGPSAAHIAAITHREIPKVHIVDSRTGGTPRDAVVVHRPKVTAAAPQTPRAVVAQREANATKQRSSPFNVSQHPGAIPAESTRGKQSLANVNKPTHTAPTPVRSAPAPAPVRSAPAPTPVRSAAPAR